MIDKLLNHVKSYQDIYSFISRGQKTEGEVREFLESTGRAESTVRTFLTSLKKRETPGLLVSKDGIIYVDAVKSRAFIDELMEVLGIPDDNELMSQFVEENAELKQQVLEYQNQITDLKEILKSEKKKQEEQERTILSLNSKIKQINSKLWEQKKIVINSVEQKVLLKDSISIAPITEAGEMALLNEIRPLIHIEPTIIETDGERASFYEDSQTDEELSEANHQKRTIRRILTDLLLRKRTEEIKEEVLTEEPVQEQECKTKIPNKTNYHKVRRQYYIQSIINSKILTNQEKLALYAFYSDYHGKDMEKLLNFAGDKNINANLLIDLVESAKENGSIANVENMLRQFAKPSLVRAKLDFAKELIAGEWYITAEYNGKPTKFTLVPIDEINLLRKAIDLPELQIEQKQIVEEKTKHEPEQEVVSEVKREELDRYSIKEENEENIPGFDDLVEKDEVSEDVQ